MKYFFGAAVKSIRFASDKDKVTRLYNGRQIMFWHNVLYLHYGMAKIFSTIITADYYPKAFALYTSLKKFDPGVQLKVLVSDNKPVTTIPPSEIGITVVNVSTLADYPLVKELMDKYAPTNPDFFRWSLK